MTNCRVILLRGRLTLTCSSSNYSVHGKKRKSNRKKEHGIAAITNGVPGAADWQRLSTIARRFPVGTGGLALHLAIPLVAFAMLTFLFNRVKQRFFRLFRPFSCLLEFFLIFL
jgi:hypothetical protein